MTLNLSGCSTMVTAFTSVGAMSQRLPRKLICEAFWTALEWWMANYSFSTDASPQNEPRFFLRLKAEEADWTP